MIRVFQTFLTEIMRFSALRMFAGYLRPALVMVAMYLAVWIDPYIFGEKTLNGLMFGLWIEFLLAHAHTATSVVSLATRTSSAGRTIGITLVSGFYPIFVLGISYAMGSVLTTVLFVLLTIKRLTTKQPEHKFAAEIFYAFFKVMIFLLTAAMGAGIAALIPADIDPTDQGQKGAEMVPAFGVCYFTAMHFYETLAAPKIFSKKID